MSPGDSITFLPLRRRREVTGKLTGIHTAFLVVCAGATYTVPLDRVTRVEPAEKGEATA